MMYRSTRQNHRDPDNLLFEDVLIEGLARDGGLYIPESWPLWDEAKWQSLMGKSYREIAFAVLEAFLGETFLATELKMIIDDAYQNFTHPDIAPLRQLDENFYLLELFHGPTLAFKDYALQLVGRLMEEALRRKNKRATILVATSGDTGSAAIEAVRGRDHMNIIVLHPKGRVSEFQRRQMTTIAEHNVLNLAIEGSFDDCQNIVKALFNDLAFRDTAHLAALNSINWARLIAQTIYYVVASCQLDYAHHDISFAVPTGNFGNVYAAWIAKKMGLSLGRLLIGTNQNDAVAQFLARGKLYRQDVVPSLSPSMDIQIPSNLERFLYQLCHERGEDVAKIMEDYKEKGHLILTPDQMAAAQKEFAAMRVDDVATLAMIREIYEKNGIVVDPHTAIGLAAAKTLRPHKGARVVALACAHPAKFGAAVEKAIGVAPEIPSGFEGIMTRPERYKTLPKQKNVVKQAILDHINR